MILGAVLLGLSFYLFREEGSVVEVTVHGELYGRYSLAEEQCVRIKTEAGENLLVIRDGAAYVSLADCPDGICAAHKPISRTGESIACLPHGVAITVRGEASDQTPDVIV